MNYLLNYHNKLIVIFRRVVVVSTIGERLRTGRVSSGYLLKMFGCFAAISAHLELIRMRINFELGFWSFLSGGVKLCEVGLKVEWNEYELVSFTWVNVF